MNATIQVDQNTVKETGQRIIENLAGFIGTKVMEIGIRKNILSAISDNEPISVHELAEDLDYDQELLQVWVDAAFGYELIDYHDDETIILRDHIDDFLLNKDFPSHLGDFPILFSLDDLFANYEENLQTGNRIWWDETSVQWRETVSQTTHPMYTRMLKTGFGKIPGVVEKLKEGARVLELACGRSIGMARIAKEYPNSTFVGVDGDKHSLQDSRSVVEEYGVEDRTEFVHTTFEELDQSNQYDIVFINASMHECRDLEKVTANVYKALKPGGIFIISDLPFPENRKEYHKLPNKLMLGVNFFEIQIDDLLLPNQDYVDLLENAGFENVEDFNLSGTHSVIYGSK